MKDMKKGVAPGINEVHVKMVIAMVKSELDWQRGC